MSSRSRSAVVVGGILVVWVAAGVMLVWGQGRLAKSRMAQPKLPDLHVDGTVDDVRPGRLQVLSNAGQTWLLGVALDATVRVTGKAAPEFLGPDQCIAFVADVDVRRSRVEEPVSKLMVFSPNPEWPLGATADQGPGSSIFEKGTQKKGERAKAPFGPGFGAAPGFGPGAGAGPGAQGPAVGPGFGAGADAGAFGGGDSRAGGRRSKSASAGPGGKAAPATQSLEVRGRITSFKGGKVTLQVPNAPFKSPLKIEIAQNAEIDVDLAGPSAITLAQKGDKVRAHGLQIGERMGQARDIEITLSQPAGAGHGKKRPAAKTERTGRSKRAAEAEEPAAKEE